MDFGVHNELITGKHTHTHYWQVLQRALREGLRALGAARARGLVAVDPDDVSQVEDLCLKKEEFNTSFETPPIQFRHTYLGFLSVYIETVLLH